MEARTENRAVACQGFGKGGGGGGSCGRDGVGVDDIMLLSQVSQIENRCQGAVNLTHNLEQCFCTRSNIVHCKLQICRIVSESTACNAIPTISHRSMHPLHRQRYYVHLSLCADLHVLAAP